MAEVFLYSKQESIAKLEKDSYGNYSLKEILIPEKMPLFLSKQPFERFPVWFEKRRIPKSREGIVPVRKEFGTSWNKGKNYASLSDQYWIKERPNDKWEKINFFNNRYSVDIGDMFFKPWEIEKRNINSYSPDLTTNGILKKRWKQNSDLSSSLYKAGSVTMHQEPLSEVLASVLLERLEIIPYVKYDLAIEGTTMCSVCDNFITENTELVPAYHIYLSEPKSMDVTVYDHLLKMCDMFEIEGAKDFIDGMIFIDQQTNNTDRNLGNFGFLRDVNTNKILGPAPLFDSGTAYWSTKPVGEPKKSLLFGDVEDNVIKGVLKAHNFSELNLDYEFEELIHNYPYVSSRKKEAMIKMIKKRNRSIKRGLEKPVFAIENSR